VNATASDTDGLAPAIGVQSTMVSCDGIATAPTPNSGCSSGLGAQAALVLQPGQSGSSTQKFRLTGPPSTVTITVGGPQTIQYTYTGSAAPTSSTTTTTTETEPPNLFKPPPCDATKGTRMLQGASTARAGSALNEVHVVAVCPDVQFHKGGAPADAWLPVERNTVLK
jgi:hypothetical protein